MRGASVTIASVAKYYGMVAAVRDVSLDVQPGEFLSLLGPSGSGKTTLLMMIAGFETPSAGVVRIGEREVTHVPPNKRDIGMVFQRYALFPHMTVADNIAFPLKMRKLPRAEINRRVGDVLALVRLDGYGVRMPSQLSGGQQQRIAVARALVFEPPVLLMDEPLGALDKKLREQMQIEIKRIQEQLGVTVIYVTHDQEEALTMSDRVVAMSDGHVAQVGTPSELYLRPNSPFVADFIGKMNFFEGEYLGSDETNALVRLTEKTTIAAPKALNGSAALFTRGVPVRLAVRPERLRLAPRGAGGANVIPGTVEEAIFVGSFQVFLVTIEGRGDDEALHVQLPADDARVAFAKGDEIDVVFDGAAVHLFSDRGA